MAKQQQAINQSEGFVVANQTVYNYTGMPALQSMPVPISSKKTFQYINKLLTEKNGNLYQAGHFDADATYTNPSTVDSSLNYSYYSDNNTISTFIPSSQGYPFAVTKYKNDGSGRPSETSGVGKAFRIGGDHTTKYTYSTATEGELIKIFGDEAPKSGKVYKMTSTDPNGVINVSLINYKGQTIATCLKANGTNAVEDIPTHKASGDYQYTLFYYGRNGNLLKTVSPKGVKNASTDRSTNPSNNFETEYNYTKAVEYILFIYFQSCF